MKNTPAEFEPFNQPDPDSDTGTSPAGGAKTH